MKTFFNKVELFKNQIRMNYLPHALSIIDKLRPRCVAKDACDIEQNMLIQKSIGIPTPPPMSGIDSLNLNITVPDIETKRQLPVLVFIHGGGFLMGSSHWPQYDPSRLVKLSVETESPVIAINIK